MNFICLMMLVASPIFQIVFSLRRIKEQTKLTIGETAFIASLSSIILSIAATPIFMNWMADQGDRCVEAALGLPAIGILYSIIASPIIATLSYLIYRHNDPTPSIILDQKINKHFQQKIPKSKFRNPKYQ